MGSSPASGWPLSWFGWSAASTTGSLSKRQERRYRVPPMNSIRAEPSGNTTHNRVVGGSNPPAATSPIRTFASARFISFHEHHSGSSPCSIVRSKGAESDYDIRCASAWHPMHATDHRQPRRLRAGPAQEAAAPRTEAIQLAGEPAPRPGPRRVQFDPNTNTYTYVWKIQQAAAGVTFMLHTADFELA